MLKLIFALSVGVIFLFLLFQVIKYLSNKSEEHDYDINDEEDEEYKPRPVVHQFRPISYPKKSSWEPVRVQVDNKKQLAYRKRQNDGSYVYKDDYGHQFDTTNIV